MLKKYVKEPNGKGNKRILFYMGMEVLFSIVVLIFLIQWRKSMYEKGVFYLAGAFLTNTFMLLELVFYEKDMEKHMKTKGEKFQASVIKVETKEKEVYPCFEFQDRVGNWHKVLGIYPLRGKNKEDRTQRIKTIWYLPEEYGAVWYDYEQKMKILGPWQYIGLFLFITLTVICFLKGILTYA